MSVKFMSVAAAGHRGELLAVDTEGRIWHRTALYEKRSPAVSARCWPAIPPPPPRMVGYEWQLIEGPQQ